MDEVHSSELWMLVNCFYLDEGLFDERRGLIYITRVYMR